MKDDVLNTLERNVARLIAENRSLREQLQTLTEANQRQRAEMLRTHEELLVCQREKQILQTAHALSGNTENREYAKRQITNMIHLIDSVIEDIAVPIS